MTDTEKPVEKTEDAPVARKRKDRQVGKKVVAGTNAIRSRIASVVWLVAVVCALFLAVGALLVALKMNQDNAIVAFVLDVAAQARLRHVQGLHRQGRRHQGGADQLGHRRGDLPRHRQGAGPDHPPLTGVPEPGRAV